jgi:acyl transferase domain-containing protein/NAD(P)-dependent dehydrogenase (short-subunit alcohol dehydrogenase family)/uncharacterized ubiquitin-like protein YukD
MPEAGSAPDFWENIKAKRYSITDVPEDRWPPSLYYDPDPLAPDKTYSKIGSWVRDFHFDPIKWGILIPASVLNSMDDSQKWAIAASREALLDYGYPDRPMDPERVAVILGNSLAGEKHYRTNLRIHIPRFTKALADLDAFQTLSPELQQALVDGITSSIRSSTPEITEDTMPGELANIIAGRVANVFNFSGANFVTDAACASSLAALQGAVDGLLNHQFDAVLTGGVDRNNGAASFVKFCKIGALSADGSRPYAEGANGFVMGEGAAVFLLKRLEDAERAQDKIYAVIRGIGSSSDGKGKGITAPNPSGQQLSIERAWKNVGVSPTSVGLIEGHGTSTKVGDVVEVRSLAAVFGQAGLSAGSIGLGSVKSNVGHLKSASGAAGMLKVIYSLHEKVLAPSANFHRPNPDIPFDQLPFRVITETEPWEKPAGEVRRAGVSSFGFGGTNFHLVMEEYVPGLLTSDKFSLAVPAQAESQPEPAPVMATAAPTAAQPEFAAAPRLFAGMVFLAGESLADLSSQLNAISGQVAGGWLPESVPPSPDQLRKTFRLAISYSEADQLRDRMVRAAKALESAPDTPWQAYTAHGIYYGEGTPGKVAFLFPGQGSQYANMMRDISEMAPVVAETYAEADVIMEPHLGRPITDYIFVDSEDEERIKEVEKKLSDTTITQPSILTANMAMFRLMETYHIRPDMLIGHSLGEYAALVAAGSITFKEGLEVVSARGRAMSQLEVDDNGCMAAVSAPIEKVEEILAGIDGYVVLANINSPVQCVVGGATEAVDQAVAAFDAAGIRAVKIPVSHAFHTRIVAPASAVLRKMLETMNLQPPRLPIAANVTGQMYPDSQAEMLELLSDHIASPVQFVKGVRALYDAGARIFVESGPKRVLSSLSRDILKEFPDVTIVATNHGRKGGTTSFHEALCSLYAAGLGIPEKMQTTQAVGQAAAVTAGTPLQAGQQPRIEQDSQYPPLTGSVVISGAGLGLPGRDRHVFSDENILEILQGSSRIEGLPDDVRQEMLDRRITRLQKGDNGAEMVMIDSLDQTLKLAGQRGKFDLTDEFGVNTDRVDALDISTQLAIGAGIEALRDAGIPLVMRYKPTSTGGYLPLRWMLPEGLADETGVIFGSAFPGLDRLAEETRKYGEHQILLEKINLLRDLMQDTSGAQQPAIEKQLAILEAEMAALNYRFDRKFIFRILNMGHSQFAEYIGARGPNTAVNAACATTTHAIAIAEDWIRTGRARRVIVVAGDDVTSGDLVSWVGTGLLATGATTTEGDLRLAALPFDLRRNGMIPGMGAAALVVESQDAVDERGMRGICEVLSTEIANSAYHGTRLEVEHVNEIMQRLMDKAERLFGIDRHRIASETMFMSHETYTPARGGSAAAEIKALRGTFAESANQVMITNTKGYTGHTMGVGIEDVVAVKGLEHSIVPPIANLNADFQPDPDLGDLNLTRDAGKKQVNYALRLGAGFGSQIAMALFRRIPGAESRVDQPVYQKWLAAAAGYPEASMEVVQRTLRVADQGVPQLTPLRSSWQYGTGPSKWAPTPQEATEIAGSTPAVQPKTATLPVTASKPDPAPVPAPAVSADREQVKDFVLNLVSEKTGYPVEILDLGLDLEADLGIDTVKQAELFASAREHYGIPRREDLRLVDYNTLEKVIGFVMENQGAPVVETSPAAAPVTTKPVPQPELVAATAPEAPVPVPAVSADREQVKDFVLNLVSEKTGYPVEILDLGLDLEADLGIDTVKQAELFASAREHYGIPRREDLRLVDYNTLEKVIGFVMENQGAAAVVETVTAETPVAPVPVTESKPEPASVPAPAASADREQVKDYVLALVSEKTGYPIEILDLGLDLEADLGIDTVKQAELFASAREHYGIPRREDLRLVDYNTLEKVIGFVMENQGAAAAVETAPAAAPVATEPVSQPEPVPATTLETPVVAPVAVPVASADREQVKDFVLKLVSEKTGYPIEILDLGLDLEADLGIDTVKQAELFATAREHYGIPRREDLRLVDYNTLEKVIGFVMENLGAPAAVETVPAELPAAPVPVTESKPEPASVPAPAASGDREQVKDFVLNLVSEKTGYPIEILDLGLDLEADLGIDTVKQAELFATAREHYGIPRREDLRLVDYNTLEKVIRFVMENLGAPAAVETVPAEMPAVENASPIETHAANDAETNTSPVQEIARRVPVPILRPRADLCLPTGVQLDADSRVMVVEDQSGAAAELVKRLAAHKVQAVTIRAENVQRLIASAENWLAGGPVSGVFYLTGLDPEPAFAEMDPQQWDALIDHRLVPLFELMKTLPEDCFLVTATRTGGFHGYDKRGAAASGAGISGFTKALAMERSETLAKVVDFDRSVDAVSVADALISETLHDRAAVEVGYHEGQRFSITLAERPLHLEEQQPLPEGAVFLVSGGTGGITLPILLDLAKKTRGRFYLMGRSPLPPSDDPDLALLRKSPQDLQTRWLSQTNPDGEKPTPVQVRDRLEALSRTAATIDAMAEIERIGGKTIYLVGDVTDREAVDRAVRKVAQEEGRIDVLLHAAGFERSRKLRRKPLEEFRQTVEVKATGLVNLYKAMQQVRVMPRAVVMFSSIAGRFGNTGQTDYSAANDLLAKFASILTQAHTGMRATALDWGAWAEVGMASRGSTPWLMEQAGIEMIAPETGAPLVYQELVYGSGHEVLLAGSLGALEEINQQKSTLDLEAANLALRSGNPPHIMLSSVSGFDPAAGVTLEVTLDPVDEPFLRDHTMNGTPLLPGVMGIEGFAVAAQHIASVLGSGSSGGFRVMGLEQIQFLTPFKFYRNEPRHIIWKAMPLWEQDGLVVAVTLESASPSRLEKDKDALVRHFSGRVNLSPAHQPMPESLSTPPIWNGSETVNGETIYELYFHGPAFQVLEGVQKSGDQLLGKLRNNLPEITSRPVSLDTTPILLELCLQTAGIWEIGLKGALSLPHSIGRVRLYRREVNGVPVFAEVRKSDNGHGLSFSSRVVDANGRVYLEMEDYRTAETSLQIAEAQRAPLRRLVGG